MTNEIRNATELWLRKRTIPNPLSVTLTLKQGIKLDSDSGITVRKLNQYDIRSNTRHFLNRLNQNVYGKRFTRFHKRLSVFTVYEGTETIRHHLHMILEKPDRFDLLEFSLMINDCWSKTTWGYSNNLIKPMIDDGWINYILKSRTKMEDLGSSIDWENCSLPN